MPQPRVDGFLGYRLATRRRPPSRPGSCRGASTAAWSDRDREASVRRDPSGPWRRTRRQIPTRRRPAGQWRLVDEQQVVHQIGRHPRGHGARPWPGASACATRTSQPARDQQVHAVHLMIEDQQRRDVAVRRQRAPGAARDRERRQRRRRRPRVLPSGAIARMSVFPRCATASGSPGHVPAGPPFA